MGKSKSGVQQQRNSKDKELNPPNQADGGLEKPIYVDKANYFEWLLDLAKIDLAKKDKDILNLKLQLFDKDMQIASLQQQLLRNGLDIADRKLDGLQKEYEAGKKKMEKEAGIPWAEYSIMDTLEVLPIVKE